MNPPSPNLCVGRHNEARTARKAHLCDSCRDRLYTHLVALPDLARMVRTNTEGLHGANDGGKVSGSRERPLPNGTLLSLLGPAAGEHLTEFAHPADQDGIVPIPDVLGGWVRMCCEERGLTGPSFTLKALCAFLREHLDFFADQPFADEFDTEVRDCHARLLGAAGLGTKRERYDKATCPEPECQAFGTLTYTPGEQSIRCQKLLGGCGLGIDIDSHSADVIRACQNTDQQAHVYRRPPQDDPDRSVRAHGADVRDEDYLRAEAAWAAKGWPRNNRTQPERKEAS